MLKSKKILSFLIIFLIFFSFINSTYSYSNEVDFELSAQSALLMEVKTGEIVFSKNPDKQLAPASMTKIMTMLLAMESLANEEISLEDKITVSSNAERMGGSQIYLEVGEKMTLEELMKAIAISSANDASVAVAEYIAGTESLFVEKMNKKAKELGMRNTIFYNTNGLPESDKNIKGNLTTAKDLAILSRELLNYPKVLDWTSIWIDYLRDGEFILSNTNKLVRHFEGVDGIKTGYTNEAGYCVAATAKKNDLRFVAIIMGAKSSAERFSEARKLLSYAFNIYTNCNIIKRGEKVEEVDVWNAKERKLELTASKNLYLPMKRGEKEEFNKEFIFKDEIKAPINRGDIIGKLNIFKGNYKIDECDLLSARKVEKASIFKIFFRIVIKFLEKLFK
ncbi:MAG: D-alanyl-D-alanine carboxypeptidase family protein [Bacillota bacterium]